MPSTGLVQRLPKLKAPSDGRSATADTPDTADLDVAVRKLEQEKKRNTFVLLLSYQAVGVIFGDLGTSPLYTFPNVFSTEPTPGQVLGAVSIIFWTLTLITVVKYICIVMCLNDNGEGGIFAMYSLLCKRLKIGQFSNIAVSSDSKPQERQTAHTVPKATLADKAAGLVKRSRRVQQTLLLLAVLGTNMTIGDGVMTACASVMSAMSGIQIPKPDLSNDVVVGISAAVIVVVFCLQRLGSRRIGFLYSPILILWFVVNASVGVFNIIRWQPDVFKAISPHYAVQYFQSGSKAAWLTLGGCVLCITGSEAMFADMGHFSHKSILIVALGLVYPSVVLIYFGEAAYLMNNTQDFAQSYFKAIPRPIYWPCFVLATAGALIGSQSLITSTFSIVRQSMHLKCFPPFRVLHTGKHVEGQIYIPVVNWLLGALTMACLLIFRSNTAIGNGFGVAVVAVMCITTLMASITMLLVWRLNPLLPLLFWLVLTFVEGIFLTSVLYKIPHGGWFPLALAAGFFFASCLWYWGTTKLTAHVTHMVHMTAESQLRASASTALEDADRPNGEAQLLSSRQDAAVHGQGLAIYPTDPLSGAPLAFLQLMRTMPVVHDAIIFLTMHKVALPQVAEADSFMVHKLGPGMYHVICRHGFREAPNPDGPFVQSMVRRICESVRYQAMTARSSAVDMYDSKTASRQHTLSKPVGQAQIPDVEMGPITDLASPDADDATEGAVTTDGAQVGKGDAQAPQQDAWSWQQYAAETMSSFKSAGSQQTQRGAAGVLQRPSSSSGQVGFVEDELRALQAALDRRVLILSAAVKPRACEGSGILLRLLVQGLYGGIYRLTKVHQGQSRQGLEISVPVFL